MGHRSRSAGDDEDDDGRLFEEAMRDVRRIEREPPTTTEAVPPHPVLPPSAPAVTAAPTDFEVEIAGEQIRAFHASLPPNARKALRRGTPRPERTVDLHGTRRAEVSARVQRAVLEARAAALRGICLITGRGLRSGGAGAVLRAEVVRALIESPLAENVLGVVSAPPALGGTGALLVMLRKPIAR